ncbi:hypothetical protein TWF694_011917 [Orbilia ellipsospora]|uniref:Uncharacterized protein n=1 Tax=Orbilia ellipsospora TaxID=2528407 RepID=A0AAV9X102_9PEZI
MLGENQRMLPHAANTSSCIEASKPTASAKAYHLSKCSQSLKINFGNKFAIQAPVRFLCDFVRLSLREFLNRSILFSIHRIGYNAICKSETERKFARCRPSNSALPARTSPMELEVCPEVILEFNFGRIFSDAHELLSLF